MRTASCNEAEDTPAIAPVLLRRVAAVAGLLLGLVVVALVTSANANAEQKHEPSPPSGQEVDGSHDGVVRALLRPVTDTVAPVLGSVTDTAAPLVRSVTETTSSVVEPVTDVAAPVLHATTESPRPGLGPVTGPAEPVAHDAGSSVSPLPAPAHPSARSRGDVSGPPGQNRSEAVPHVTAPERVDLPSQGPFAERETVHPDTTSQLAGGHKRLGSGGYGDLAPAPPMGSTTGGNTGIASGLGGAHDGAQAACRSHRW